MTIEELRASARRLAEMPDCEVFAAIEWQAANDMEDAERWEAFVVELTALILQAAEVTP